MPSDLEIVARVAELTALDVLDVTPEGRLRLNAAFRKECCRAYDENPGALDTVVQSCIVARAVEYGYAGVVDVDELALIALEVAASDEAPTAS